MSAREVRAEMLTEGDVLVRGTLDAEEAWLLARALLAEDEYGTLASRNLGDIRRRRAFPGWYRKVPCRPGSYGRDQGWTWQLWPARAGDCGAFPGVQFPSYP